MVEGLPKSKTSEVSSTKRVLPALLALRRELGADDMVNPHRGMGRPFEAGAVPGGVGAAPQAPPPAPSPPPPPPPPPGPPSFPPPPTRARRFHPLPTTRRR